MTRTPGTAARWTGAMRHWPPRSGTRTAPPTTATIFKGTGAGFAAWVTEIHLNFDRHSHQINNVLVEVDSSGERAVSEAYVTVALWSSPDVMGAVTQVTSRGRYLDRWELRDGRWGIAARHYVEDFTTAQQLASDEIYPASKASRRDPDDPSYALFSSLS